MISNKNMFVFGFFLVLVLVGVLLIPSNDNTGYFILSAKKPVINVSVTEVNKDIISKPTVKVNNDYNLDHNLGIRISSEQGKILAKN